MIKQIDPQRAFRYLACFLTALTASCATGAPKQKSVALPSGPNLHFTAIPAGSFRMGSPEDERGRQADEGPVREVHIRKAFYMGIYEVTQSQWEAVMGENPSVFQTFPDSGEHPVDRVSWHDAQAFIDKLNALGLGRFRLPTEAEWEYACRAGTETRYHWGTDASDWQVHDYAWAFPLAEGRSHPVGQNKPNAWGLYDMSGNVWEWCEDWRSDRYDPADTLNPKGAAEGTKKVYRGGSWFNKPATLRSANRNGHPPDERQTNTGLRLVLEIE
ncbi:MAG: formylglycine-generating enzyme family protein [Opitutales bacterium]